MYNKVFKNYQVNMGIPFQVKAPIAMHTLKEVKTLDTEEDTDNGIEENADKVKEDIINKAKEEADLIIQEARYEAIRMMETAEKEAEECRMALEEEARRNGFELGYNEAKKQYEDLIQEAEYIKEHARIEYKDVLDSIESDAVNVILSIARKVIGTELSTDKDTLLSIVKQAFDKCANKENVTLKVSADDYDYLVENKDRLLSMVEGIGNLEIKRDPALKAGACLVETPYGSVDAGVQTKLDKIERAFRSVIGK